MTTMEERVARIEGGYEHLATKAEEYLFKRKKLLGAQTGNCEGCGEHFLDRSLTIDHIVPVSKGGTDHLENLQLLCGACNSLKGDRPMEYLWARACDGSLRRLDMAMV